MSSHARAGSIGHRCHPAVNAEAAMQGAGLRGTGYRPGVSDDGTEIPYMGFGKAGRAGALP